MADDCMDIEEHELPSVEAVLACALALMTGYSQALQAEVHPRRRLAMSEKITSCLAALVDHPMLSLGFRQVLLGLDERWRAMGACTRDAAQGCADPVESPPQHPRPRPADDAFERRRPEPKRLH